MREGVSGSEIFAGTVGDDRGNRGTGENVGVPDAAGPRVRFIHGIGSCPRECERTCGGTYREVDPPLRSGRVTCGRRRRPVSRHRNCEAWRLRRFQQAGSGVGTEGGRPAWRPGTNGDAASAAR